ncbi:flagellar hook assembly protein FlgD [Salibacterium halotolerans]|uniref:Flagellar basal-body rod modification protein FlgD n=1 Tax=Salibacterium halotolerans TaxID=1884432 RepID=A0A1I5MDJ0_9BACI|nr:flagellar hook assembly protein FlgD [Salibacterium halotolerans]SFP07590.1 flagellar basal-body rod modification protein FlgD [Salibacterium halotolerans]
MANTIQDQYALPTQTDKLRTNENNGKLGKDDFLKILMTQLQNQSPANPMKDKEFISQMAQFSTLEQMTNMTSAITDMANAQQKGSLVQHSQLIGKTVTWEHTVKDENGVEQTEEKVNEVTSVKQDKSGTIRLLMDSGQWVNSEQMIQVEAASDDSEETGNNGQNSAGS